MWAWDPLSSLPIVMGVASSTSDVTVTAQSDLLETARTQVAGTVSQSEVRSLPPRRAQSARSGAAGSPVLSTNTAANQLFAENFGGPRPGDFRGKPAELLQQFHCR